jgi:hypothetical protein
MPGLRAREWGAGLRARLRAIELRTRPEAPGLSAALARRWAELPQGVRGPGQMLGRRISGCEGTQGVFPRCDLACTPCYHSRDANRVPVSGAHTLRQIEAQMDLLLGLRGPGQHCQLIGGEVTLLGPEHHAAALERMLAAGRIPMSFSHGDFDYDYLRALALRADGTPRFAHLAFAIHIDSTMRGRRGAERPAGEAELHAQRRRVCEMFARLRREHGVTSLLAHNMTVTPQNLDQVPEVVRAAREMGFRLLSFQPAAHLGNPARWRGDYRAIGQDDVWRRIEEGAGARLHHRTVRFGDPRCNRTAYGGFAGGRYWTLFDDDDPRDAAVLEAFLRAVGGMSFARPRRLLLARLVRAAARHPRALALAPGFGLRLARRMGPRALRHRPRAVTFVVHSFMDEAVVRPAWEAMERGESSDDPDVRAAQERLRACSYAMAHPEEDRVVPACVQHAVYDPVQNRLLAEQLGAGSSECAPTAQSPPA